MHHDRIRFCAAEFVGSQAIALEKFVGAWQQRAVHALVLQAQHDNHVAAFQPPVHVVEYRNAHALDIGRDQCFRSDHPHIRTAQRGECVQSGAGDARMQHIADDRDTQIVKRFLVVADGVHVQQALGRMGMAAVAGVDHRDAGLHVLRDQVRGPGLGVSHHEHVGIHRGEVVDRIEQRFAFAGRRHIHVEIDHIRRQALGGNFKRGAGAGRVFEKQIEHRLAAQDRHLLHLAIAHAHELVRRFQQGFNQILGQALGAQQVFQFAAGIQLWVESQRHKIFALPISLCLFGLHIET